MTHETPQRIFQIGSTRIVEDESTAQLTNEQVRELLKRRYPEVAYATIEESEQDGARVVTLRNQPGRKG